MSYVSREIHTRQCCCIVFSNFRRHCHSAVNIYVRKHQQRTTLSSDCRRDRTWQTQAVRVLRSDEKHVRSGGLEATNCEWCFLQRIGCDDPALIDSHNREWVEFNYAPPDTISVILEADTSPIHRAYLSQKFSEEMPGRVAYAGVKVQLVGNQKIK